MQDTPPCGFSLRKLQVYHLQFCGDGFQGINVRLHDGFSQQGAHGGLKGFRQRDQQVRVGDRYSLFPF